MGYTDRFGVDGGIVIILGIGIVLFGLHVTHALGEGENFRTFLFGILIPMLLAASVIVGTIWQWRQNLKGKYNRRIALWCTIGNLVLALGAVLIILYQEAEGVRMSDQLFVVVNAASVGAVSGFVVGVYDYRQRQAQAEANRLSRQLTVLNRVLRHDIRNDANVIHGRAEVLADGRIDIHEQAETIQRQAAGLAQLGEYARQVEKLLLEDDTSTERVDISKLAESVCERVQTDNPRAEFERSLDGSQFVEAHPLVESAVSNVVENAVEHCDKPTPQVTVRVVEDPGDEYVELSVADNGPGIPEREIAILERGYETELDHMSGLGLWLVNWILTASDGGVSFEENDPQGSIVFLRFKRSSGDNPPDGEPSLS